MGIRKFFLAAVFSACAASALGAQDRSPIFLGVVSSAPDKTVFLYSTYPEIVKNSKAAYIQMYKGKYSCCFRVGNMRNTTTALPVQDETEKPISVYVLTKDKSIIRRLPPYGTIFGVALKRGALVTKVDDSNYVVTYANRKARLRMCTSIESIHIYFQEEGVGEPMTHLYYPLDYGVDPTCEETLKVLEQNPPSAKQ